MNAIEELLIFISESTDPRSVNCETADSLLKKWREGDWADRIMAELSGSNRDLYHELKRCGEPVIIPPPPDAGRTWTMESDQQAYVWVPLENRWVPAIPPSTYKGGPA